MPVAQWASQSISSTGKSVMKGGCLHVWGRSYKCESAWSRGRRARAQGGVAERSHASSLKRGHMAHAMTAIIIRVTAVTNNSMKAVGPCLVNPAVHLRRRRYSGRGGHRRQGACEGVGSAASKACCGGCDR